MSDITPNFGLPYILPSQAQKHVTHNEALRMLDGLVQISVADRDLAVPPARPAEGERYLVPAAASGAWTGKVGTIAAWQDGAWSHVTPRSGWLAWIADEARLMVFDGSDWIDPPSAAQTPLMGINAPADATSRLVVASAATLFTHAGAGHQHKINKAAAGDTASLLFQTNWSGRAEFGLAGSDDLQIKTSLDGAAWKTAVTIDRATGFVGFLGTKPTAPVTIATDAGGLAAGQAAISVHGGAGAERIEFQSVSATPNAASQGFGARGTIAAPTATQNDDRLFALLGSGHDSTAFVVPLAAQIDLRATGNWSRSSHGACIVFVTTPSGSTVAARADACAFSTMAMSASAATERPPASSMSTARFASNPIAFRTCPTLQLSVRERLCMSATTPAAPCSLSPTGRDGCA